MISPRLWSTKPELQVLHRMAIEMWPHLLSVMKNVPVGNSRTHRTVLSVYFTFLKQKGVSGWQPGNANLKWPVHFLRFHFVKVLRKGPLLTDWQFCLHFSSNPSPPQFWWIRGFPSLWGADKEFSKVFGLLGQWIYMFVQLLPSDKGLFCKIKVPLRLGDGSPWGKD